MSICIINFNYQNQLRNVGLIERKRTIKNIYDGYIFQLYAQYYSLSEMGYSVKELQLYSYTDNKVYKEKLPTDNLEMLQKFEQTLIDLRNFTFENFHQTCKNKCENCIYEPACD